MGKKLILFCSATALALALALPSVSNAQISVIVSKSNSYKINESYIKDIFATANLTWPDGKKVLVVDQSGTDAGTEFYKKTIGKSVNQIRTLWTKLVLSGQATAPRKCDSDTEVMAAVSASAEAIGFIASKSLNDSVKEIFKIE